MVADEPVHPIMTTESEYTLGVVMLDTRFPRPRGDIGNAATFPFPTLYRTVPAATVASVVVSNELDPALVEGIAVAAEDLAGQGADIIATSCGFLAPVQEALSRRIGVPVIASALTMLPDIRARHAPSPVGIVTFDSRRLSPHHFGDAYDPSDVIEGIESGAELHPVISEDRPDLDMRRAEADVAAAVNRILSRCQSVGAIVFECTNLSPYRAAAEAACGCTIYDINQAILNRASGHVGLGSSAHSA